MKRLSTIVIGCAIVLTVSADLQASLDHTQLTLIEQQDNYPLLNESVAPTAGYPWSWSASGLSGFSGAPSFWFEYSDDGSGEPNELHTQAELHWSGIVASNWQNGITGAFTLTQSNGHDSDRNYIIELTLRSLVSDGYTLIQQQTSGGSIMNSPGAQGFSFIASGFSGMSPSPTSITFDAMGAITSCVCANWNQNGTFTFTVTDGSRPASVISGVALSLRSLVSDGYTLIQQQTSGSSIMNSPGAQGFSFFASGFSGMSPSPTSIAFDAMGAITSCVCANWNQNGTFTFTVTDGSRPASVISGVALSLRSLVGGRYFAFVEQDAGGNMINALGVQGFACSASGVSGLTPTPSLSFDAQGGVKTCAPCLNTPQDGTFTLTIADGTRPESVIPGVGLSLRDLTPNTLTVDPRAGDGNQMIQVNGDLRPWDWTNWDDGLPISMLTASNTYGSADLTVSWLADDLHEGEYGCGHMTIAPSDGSAPSSTLCLDIEILSATCCQGVTGNVNSAGIVDLSDLSALVSYLTGGGYVLPCPAEANVNATGIVDLSDLSALVSYLTGGGYVLPSCP